MVATIYGRYAPRSDERAQNAESRAKRLKAPSENPAEMGTSIGYHISKRVEPTTRK